MRAALERAGIGPERVDYINAHGTSTPLNGPYESMAISDVFGEHASRLAISSTKGMTGHMMGAAGAFEGFVCARVAQSGLIPPTINYRHPDPELTLDYVPNAARQTDARVTLSNSMGLGGHNSSIIMRRYEEGPTPHEPRSRPPPRSRHPPRRAVITGMGAITPIGNDAETFWANLTAGVSGAGPITAYDPTGEEVRIAAEVKGFDPVTWMAFKQPRRMARFSQLAVAAAAQAIAQSGLQITDANRDDIAVVLNTGGGGIGDVALGERVFLEHGGKRVSPFMVPMLSPSMAACQISIQNGLRGPVITSVAACASGVQAFVEAQRLIEHGDADVVITGGTESAPMFARAAKATGRMGALSK